MTFVGVKKNLSVSDLLNLISELAIEPSYYFLRWSHQVSQDWETKPIDTDFPMLEGQMFNQQCELRWKRKPNDNYEILLLTVASEKPDLIKNLIKIGDNWQTKIRDAYIHDAKDQRFPKKLPPEITNIAQRYFIDPETAKVHFIALTIK